MNKNINEEIKKWWDDRSDNYYRDYTEGDTLDIIKNNPKIVFPTAVWANINRYYPSLEGVKICVPSSGDNKAVFGFHLLGAEVTACDMSPNQVKNAKRVADSQGWDIRYHVQDSMVMDEIADGYYDMVYTSNGVHTWISDLPTMHRQFYRIIKDGGRYIFFETHPFIRPFDDSTNELKVRKPYSDTSNFDWRVQEFVNSLIESGFTITRYDELHSEKDSLGANWWNDDEWDSKSDWRINPYAALPQWLAMCCEK